MKNLIFYCAISMLVLLAMESRTQFDNKAEVPVSLAMKGQVNVDIIDSPVEVIGHAQSTVIFEPVSEDKTFQDMIFEIAKEGNTVFITSNRKRSKGVKIKLYVPSQFSVTIKTIYGEYVRVKNIAGDISIYDHAGNIELRDVTGSLDLYTARGNIEVQAKSFSTEIPSILSSVYGNIKLIIPATASATFQIDSHSQKIQSDFDLKRGIKESKNSNDLISAAQTLKTQENSSDEKDKAIKSILGAIYENTVSRTINGGGPIVKLKLHSGELSIRKSK